MKVDLIMKMGQPLTLYGRNIGVCLRQVSDEVFLISMSNGGVSWKEEVHIDDISLGGEFKKVNKENEYVEPEEDESCAGGACKI